VEKVIQGKAYLFGNNIDTDQIYPGRYLEFTDPKAIAQHVLEGADPTFGGRFDRKGIIVAGTNFGCGSSREHAAITLQAAGVRVVVAESFARIFYRNCINLGLPLLVCPDILARVKEGDLLEVNLVTGKVKNLTQGEEYQGEELSGHALHILENGGIKPLMQKKYGYNQE
jgi:3-isopropylmalate/(R)-2-methylmalate dehydratase small subunit